MNHLKVGRWHWAFRLQFADLTEGSYVLSMVLKALHSFTPMVLSHMHMCVRTRARAHTHTHTHTLNSSLLEANIIP